MKWMIVASLTVAVFLTPVHGQQTGQLGPCASIGYSTSCCPRSLGNLELCRVGNNCGCGDDCHAFGDCCSDNACPGNPRTCAEVGIYQCCTDTTPGACEVRDDAAQPPHYCSCNISCHLRGDCCSDALTLCVPRTCAEAGRDVGCCQWSSASSCFVRGGGCYCDSYCHVLGDCCNDVLPNCNRPDTQSWRRQQSRVQSVLEQELTASQLQNYYRGRGGNTATDNSGYTHHRMALAARTQRVRGNTNTANYYREFGRGRARVNAQQRPPHPPPYPQY